MSTTSCMKQAGSAMRAEDKAAIFAGASAYRKEGLKPDPAGIQSARDQLAVAEKLLAKEQATSARGKTESVTNPKDVVSDKITGTDEATGLPLNADGTVTVYHHTSKEAAESIRQTGTLKAQAEPDVYVTTRRETDTGYGDTAVAINVNPEQLAIDDEFPDGRKDFRLTVGKPGGSIKVTIANESTTPDSGGGLTSPTQADILTQQQAKEDGEKASAKAKRDTDKKLADEQTAKDNASRFAGAVENFKLGETADQNLSGQGDIRFSFAGKQAATADTHQLETAERRLKNGVRPEAVLRDTGWSKGVDGKMRFEISDKDALLKAELDGPNKGKSIGRLFSGEDYRTLGAVLHHPALFAAYPALANMPIKFVGSIANPGVRGSLGKDGISISEDASPADALSTLLHEIQHGIQGIEGFASGGSPDAIYWTAKKANEKINGYNRTINTVYRDLEAARAEKDVPRATSLKAQYDELLSKRSDLVDAAQADPLDTYRRLAGEVEARNTQTRAGFSDEERRLMPAYTTADVKDSDVIVTFNGKEMHSAPAPANGRASLANTQKAYTAPNGLQAAPARQQQLADQLAALIGANPKFRGISPVLHAVTARAGDTTDRARSLAAVAVTAKRLFGHEVVFVDFGASPLFNGAMSRAIPGVVFIRVDSPKPHMAILGHELLHQLRASNPGLYNDLDAALTPLLAEKGASEFLDKLSAGYKRHGLQVPNNWDEELWADVAGDNFMDPEFLQALGAEQPALFKRVVDAITKFLNTVIAKLAVSDLQPFGTRQYLTDAKAAREAVAKAFREFSGTQVGAMTDQRDTVAMSIADNQGGRFADDTTPSVRDDVVSARSITPPHEVRDKVKALSIAKDMARNGWSGRPLLVWKRSKGLIALTGSHRIAAARKNGIKVPIVYVEQQASKWEDPNGLFSNFESVISEGDDRTERFLRRAGDERAANLMQMEIDENESTAPSMSIADKPLQTETAAFKKWFGDSKVVDAKGEPLVVYHGTRRPFNVFSPSKPRGAPGNPEGIYFTADKSAAEEYAQDVDGAWDEKSRVVAAYIKIENDADGQIIDSAYRGREYVVFKPENIKSATGNNGDFDPTNPDISLSIAQPGLFQPNIWSTPDPTRMDTFLYNVQDGKIDLRRTQEAILKSGQTIAEQYDARLAETLYPGRVAYRSQTFLEAEAQPLLKAMHSNKVGMDELADYLHARGAEERNVQIAKVNPAMPDGGAGTNTKGTLLTTQAAKDYLTAISPVRKLVLDAMAKRVDAITAGTRTLLVSEGLEKQDTIDAWTAAYKNYVPMFRDEADEGFPSHPQGSGFTVKGSASKRAMGSKKEVTNILAHVLMQREAAITRAEKNRVALALYGQALSHPNPEFWTTIKPGMKNEAIGKELEAMGVNPDIAVAGMAGVPTIQTIDPNTGKVVNRPNPMYRMLPGAIPLKVNGEDRVLMLNVKNERGARLAESLKNLDGLTNLDLAGSIVGRSTRWLAAVNTQYNPAFGLVNLTRDTLGGVIHLGNTELRGESLITLAKTPIAILGIARELAGWSDAGKLTGKWQKLYTQFVADGGQTGFKENFRDPNDRAKAIEKELKAIGRGALSPGKYAHAALDLLDGFNTTLENAVRLSAYSAALDKGISRPQAARLGRELTVDFNRKGRLGREVGPLYAFFNASVQGMARTMQAIKGPTGGKIIAGGLSLGILQALMLAAAGYDDDEIPEFVKTRALIIPLPRRSDDDYQAMAAPKLKDGTEVGDAVSRRQANEKRFISIPYPLGLHVLPNTGRVLTELVLNGGKDIGKRSVAAIGEIAGAFNPLGGGNILTADGALKTIAPTLLDPIIEVVANKNFAGSSIEKRGFGAETDNRPGVNRVRESTQRSTTGQGYIGISKAMNWATGGSDYEAGAVSPTPEMVRYLAQTVGGGVLREIEKIINASTASARGDKVKASQIPVLGRFYGEVENDDVQRSRYFKTDQEMKKLTSVSRELKKSGTDADMDAYEKKHPEMEAVRDWQRAERRIAKLNKLAVETINDPKELRSIDADRAEEMRDLNQTLLDMEKATGKTTPAEAVRKAAVKAGWK